MRAPGGSASINTTGDNSYFERQPKKVLGVAIWNMPIECTRESKSVSVGASLLVVSSVADPALRYATGWSGVNRWWADGGRLGKVSGRKRRISADGASRAIYRKSPLPIFPSSSRVALDEKRTREGEKNWGATELKRAGRWTVHAIDDKVGWVYLIAPANEHAVSKIAVGAFGVGLATGEVPILRPGRPILKA